MSRAVNRIIREKLGRFAPDGLEPVHPRALDLGEPAPPREGNPVIALTGVRRCGKTYRLFQEMGRLLAMGVPPTRICYFDFGDERLETVTPETGERVIGTFDAWHPEALEEGVYLFFDGIHAMADWREWLPRIASRRKATIYAAGSSLEDDPGASEDRSSPPLRPVELHPYSYAEYRLAAPADDWRGDAEPVDNEMRFTRQCPLTWYLASGGFPETVGLPGERRVRTLQDVVSRALLEDVIEPADVHRPRLARRFTHRVLAANGQTLSLRKVARDFRNAGLTLELKELDKLLELLLRARLVHRIPYCDVTGEDIDCGFSKVYTADPGMARACARVHGNNVSFLLEDVVYLELLRRATGRPGSPASPSQDVPTGCVRCLRDPRTRHEVDFLVGDPLEGGPSALYQVTWDIEPRKVQEREVRSILEAFDAIARLRGDGDAGLPTATIIIGSCTAKGLAETRRYLETLGGRASRIALVSADAWLLGEDVMPVPPGRPWGGG